MARGQDDGNADDGPILSPEELDITDDEHVAEIDEGRFVVSPNEPVDLDRRTVEERTSTETGESTPGGVADGATDDGASRSADRPSSDRTQDSTDAVTETDVREWQATQFAESDSRYGFDVAATFDGSTSHRRMVSNDVVTIFESLVLWYAQGIDSTTPVEEVLGILLMEANVPIRYPPESLRTLLESTGLGPDDSIADLVEAVDEDGFRL